jgi:hypothetical protein
MQLHQPRAMRVVLKVLERREDMNTEEIFQQVMNENCKDPLHRFAELVRQDERERIWVGLTDEEIAEGVKQSWVTEQAFQSAVWWAEAKLKERNT